MSELIGIEQTGEIIAYSGLAHLNSSNLNKGALIDRVLPLAAQLAVLGTDVQGLLAPLTNHTEALAELENDSKRSERALNIRGDMSVKFSTRDQEIRLDETSVIPVFSKGSLVCYAATITRPLPLLCGETYNEIMSKSRDNSAYFKQKVGRQSIDTRQGMTLEVARALSLHAVARFAASNPDRKPIKGQVAEPRLHTPGSSTWLTGITDSKLVHAAGAPCVQDGVLNAELKLRSRTGRWNRVGFRPVVILPK